MSALQDGLHTNTKRRLGIEAFTRLFKRTTDGRYVDSRMCADTFDPLDYESSDQVTSVAGNGNGNVEMEMLRNSLVGNGNGNFGKMR
ncbi:hypothetical protein AAVH_21177 [Aphelenchoides avenae]|nr:hypothetical protein AAVH_21177 [Aphelenchus avenae]